MTRRRHQSCRTGTCPAALRGRLLAIALAGVAGAMLTTADRALAHVDIEVGEGRYVMEIGFRDEPAYLGQPNALSLSVEEYATGGTEPVAGLAATLNAEVSRDGQTKELALAPVEDGAYEAVFVPTASGDYTFRIFGTIGEATVDESVTSGPTTFNSVEPLTAIEFPVTRPDLALLQAETANAQASAETARALGIAGIVAGVLGVIVAAVALTRSRRPTSLGAMPASASPASPAALPLESEPSGKLIR